MISAFSRPSRLAIVAALPVLLAAKPLTTPMAGGTTYEFIVRSQTGDNKESVMMRGRGTFAGNDGRIEIAEASSAGGSEVFGAMGSYFLVLDGGKRGHLQALSRRFAKRGSFRATVFRLSCAFPALWPSMNYVTPMGSI